MAITHAQKIGQTSGNGVSTISVSPPANTTIGNIFTVAVVWYRSSGAYPTCSVSDSKGNTYSTFYSYTPGTQATTGPNLLIATSVTTASILTTDSVTATFSGGAGAPFSVILADEWSGLSSTQDGSTVPANSISGSSVAFGTLTTTNANDLVLAYVASSANLTATSWSGAWNTNKEFQSASPTISMSWQIVSSTQSFSGTATLSASSISNYALFALQQSGGGGTQYTSFLSALGVG